MLEATVATATQTMRAPGVAARRAARSPNVFREMWEHRADYLYILPALAAMGVVILYPLIRMFIISFQYTSPYTGKTTWVGLDNFKDAVSDEHFGLIVVNTLIWTVASTLLALLLGMIAALAISRPLAARPFTRRGRITPWIVSAVLAAFMLAVTRSGILALLVLAVGMIAALAISSPPHFRTLARGMLITPWIISAVTAAFIWKWMYNADSGVISGLLIQLHIISHPIKFIDSTNLVLWSVIVANVWKSFPFAMILILAGLQTIPEQLYNAAKIDGAGRWARFREITLPQLAPVLTVTSILLVFGNMNAFTFIQVLTGGGPTYHSSIFAVQVYAQAFVGSPHFELAAALGVILFVILMAFAAIYLWILAQQSRVRPVLLEAEEGGLTAASATTGGVQ